MVEKDAIADVRWYICVRSELLCGTDGRKRALEPLDNGLCRRFLDAARQMLRDKSDMTSNWSVDVDLYPTATVQSSGICERY